MEKLTIGRKRKTDIKNDSIEHYPELLTAIGLSTMCIMLMLSIISTAGSSSAITDSTSDAAVAVMSSAVEETVENKREELVMPDKKASAMEDESLFETIGKFFADLILSEG